ncbi:MAG: hypothetical protein QOI91_2543 [Solirubrobacteraceae bacterium]|jgi:hypothetical protein|nr:hypothetical protein [Solirubrobacteraceae bacterium]
MRAGRAAAGLAAAVALAVTGCGQADTTFPAACHEGTRAIQKALEKAPAPVALADGTTLSSCVNRARDGADLQTVGAFYTAVADGLAARVKTSDAAALRLGYLLGAARKGARTTNGIHEELVRRLEQSARVDGATPARQAAFRRGLAAGGRHG